MTSPTVTYSLSLHDALPICICNTSVALTLIFEAHATSLDNEAGLASGWFDVDLSSTGEEQRSEEHTSELQSHVNLVCRLLLEKIKFQLLRLSLATPARWTTL